MSISIALFILLGLGGNCIRTLVLVTLWNKTNQAVTAGRATETISFNGSYTGPVTILINNIKSSNVMTGSITTHYLLLLLVMLLPVTEQRQTP
jgi:hypothetical protein